MKDQDFKNIFEGLNFDIEEPKQGHKNRFAKKLQAQNKNVKPKRLWSPILGIAASFTIVILLVASLFKPQLFTNNADLAGISFEMKQTEEFYSGLIKQELNALNKEKSAETEAIIKDALFQIDKLEKEYQKLRKDLSRSGKDKRVIHAMISNFQQRIDLLNSVLNQIEELKTLKNKNYESTII